MPQVFLSYSSIDADWVDGFDKVLRSELQKRDPAIETWRDRNKLRTGDLWNEELERVVRQADFFCPIVSGAWARSQPCQRECAVFLENPAHHSRVAAAVTAAGVDSLDEELLKRHHTKFYRVKDGRNVDYAPTTETARRLIAAIAEDIVQKLRAPDPPGPNNLIEEIRTLVAPEVRARCGTMRVLSMREPVPIDGIYTDVNILEKLSAHQYLTTEDVSRETAARFGLGAIREERVPAKTALERCPTLMILGQPGAGKTTFLKRIAMECLNGTFRPTHIPVFIGLKEFSDLQPAVSLPQYIRTRWLMHPRTEDLLRAGHALILLDGLDEVSAVHFNRVRDGIDQLTAEYSACPVVLACRIAAQKYTFARFTEVELTNFTHAQMITFATKWFSVKHLPHKVEPFQKKLEDAAIRELASSPLLLTLLCLLFEERENIEGDRAELYRKAFEVLLEKWDGTRGNERLNPYRGLGVDEKENLLGEIAFQRFVQNEYLFRQDSLERQIREFFVARPRLIEDGIRLDPQVVLNSIESQHGLLIKRSQDYYSFSHLTFQEFLAARQIQTDPHLWAEVAPRMTEPRWREVLLLTVTMGKPEFAIKALKNQLDLLVESDAGIQELLAWCARKVEASGGSSNQPARRAFYLSLVRPERRNLTGDLAHAMAQYPLNLSTSLAVLNTYFSYRIDLIFDHTLAQALDREDAISHNLAISLDLELAMALDLAHNRAFTRAKTLMLSVDRAFAIDEGRTEEHPFAAQFDQPFDSALDRAIARAAALASDQLPELAKEIESLISELPTTTRLEWWQGPG